MILLLLALSVCIVAPAADRPNVVIIYGDDVGFGDVGVNGSKKIPTPNIDKLASEGIRFTRCVTNSPVCIPMRVSLATGRYPHNTRIWENMNHDMSKFLPGFITRRLQKKEGKMWVVVAVTVVELLVLGFAGKLIYDWLAN